MKKKFVFAPFLIFLAVFTLCPAGEANNARQFAVGRTNFFDVTSLIDSKYDKKVDLATLFENAWKHVYKKSWDKIEPIIPAPNDILAATYSPHSTSEEIRDLYARKIENTLQMYAKAQTDEATTTVRELWNQSAAGLVLALDDPYSKFLPAEAHRQLQDSLSGKADEDEIFYGVGISVEWDVENDLGVLVIAPLPGTPAEKNDIRAGDIIIGASGEYFSDWEDDYQEKLERAIDLIKGKKDTEVTLMIKKPNVPEPVEVTLKRAPINPHQLISKEMLNDNIGIIRLASFYANAAQDLKDAMRYLKLEGMEKMILDLRFNPGGYLDQAIKVAEIFLHEDELITYTYGRESPTRKFFDDSTDEEGFSDIPLIILLNEYSASASEVVTGALKDNQRAIVVGKTSFGKGSVQEVFPLKDKAGLRLTVAHYYSPSGVCIHEIGIKPDVEVDPLTEEKWDKIKEKDYTHVPRLERMFERDPQLHTAYKIHMGDIEVHEIKRLADIQEEMEDKNKLAAKHDVESASGEE